MTEQVTTPTGTVTPPAPEAAPIPPAPPAPPKKSAGSRKKKKKIIKRIIAIVVVVALIVGVAFVLRKFVFPPEAEKTILTDFVQISSIQSMVEGSGSAKAKDSATVTPTTTGGEVLEVYVTDGDPVTVGQPLYRIDSTEAEEAVQKAQEDVNDYQKQLNDLYDTVSDLTVTAPYAGKLLETGTFQVGDTPAKDEKIALLVDDSKLKLTLYFNYAYEGQIKVGQAAQISIPATMSTVEGTVDEVNYVRKVVPEGSVLFQVVLVLNNSGTLTADMEASATLTDGSGEVIFPYESGKLEYYRTTELKVKATGPIESVDLMDYADVKAGQVLLAMGSKNLDSDIAEKKESLKTAQKSLDEAVKKLDSYSAVSPIDGNVLSCTLVPGTKVETGQGINIANTTTMIVEINVDERNVNYIKAGMMIDLTDWNGNYFMGTVTSVSLDGKYENGVTTYPATITVDNTDGLLMNNMGMNYSLVASESENCLVVPIQSVKYVSDDAGETMTVVYVKSDTRPENAIDLPETAAAEMPEGFFAVPVEVGISDTYNVEILSGLEEGMEIFTNTLTDNANTYGW